MIKNKNINFDQNKKKLIKKILQNKKSNVIIKM